MANKIAGLTIEIGGDTTGLTKALGDVNKQSKNLQSELRETDKLLKLDPKNTTLIAQKQKLLAESVDNTTDKLGKLKDAEKQAQAQFAKGDVGEDQYRAIQREVIKTEEELKKLEKAAKDFGGSMKQSLKNTGKDIQDFGGKVKGAGQAFAPVSAGAAAVLTGLVANTEATKEYREEMGKLETAFTTNGHSAEAAEKVYKEFYGLLGETDRSVEAVNHLAKLTTTEKELTDWTTIATGIFATFGDSLPIEGLTEAANETAKTGALTGVLADALTWAGVSEDEFKEKLEGATTEQERSKLIAETLMGIYSESANKYREVNGELITANKTQDEFNSTMAELGEVTQPLVNDVMGGLVDVLGKVIDWIKNLDEGTLKMILTILAVVAGIAPLLIIIGQVITAVGAITAALPVLGAAFALLTGPVGLVIAIVGGLIAAGVLLFKNWDTIKEKAGEIWEGIKTTFSGAINFIKGLFNFEWSFPKIKMPHFNIQGKFSLSPPSIPKLGVEWYKEGGIFTKPQVIGVGEGGEPEGVFPLSFLKSLGLGESQTVNHTGTITVRGVNNRGELVAVVEQAITKKIMQDNRRLPNRASIIPL